MNVYQKLKIVQRELKAPKSQFNSFGKYHYRSCEDILEAAKPLCNDNDLVLSVSDEIVLVGDRYYVKATAKVICVESGESHESSAIAREEENKKGMDSAQLTGSTSSYARKYALNGLFSIDDTKDSDATNTHEKSQNATGEQKTQPKAEGLNDVKKLSEGQIKRLYAIAKAKGLDNKSVDVRVEKNLNCKVVDMTKAQYEKVVAAYEAIVNEPKVSTGDAMFDGQHE